MIYYVVTKNVFFEIHLPKTKPINEHFLKLDLTNKETYILGGFNINLCYNVKYIICKNNTLVLRSVSNDTRNYHQLCTMFCLKQIIKSSTRITCRNTSLIEHILTSIPA